MTARLTVVGCGTVVPEPDRACSAYHLEMGEVRLLMDCGPGAVQAMARLGLEWDRLTHLAITHFHPDHIGALGGLFFSLRHGLSAPRSRPLTVVGPPGTAGLFARLAAAFGEFMRTPGFPVGVREVEPGDELALGGEVRLAAHKTPHTAESLAFRIDGPEGSVGYSGDTGATETLGPFFAGVDVLVCECSLRDDEVGDNHLSPLRVARIAAAAAPGTLVLTHVYPHFRLAEDVPARVAESGYGGRTVVAEEGLAFDLGSGP